MKSTSHLFRAADVWRVGLLAVLAGCTSALISQTVPAGGLMSSVTTAGTPENQEPVPLTTVAPVYPTAMQRSSISGVVNVTCLIDANGRVREAKIHNSTDNAFNQAALEAVRQWTFRPAQCGGMAVPARVNIPLRFTIKE